MINFFLSVLSFHFHSLRARLLDDLNSFFSVCFNEKTYQITQRALIFSRFIFYKNHANADLLVTTQGLSESFCSFSRLNEFLQNLRLSSCYDVSTWELKDDITSKYRLVNGWSTFLFQLKYKKKLCFSSFIIESAGCSSLATKLPRALIRRPALIQFELSTFHFIHVAYNFENNLRNFSEMLIG